MKKNVVRLIFAVLVMFSLGACSFPFIKGEEPNAIEKKIVVKFANDCNRKGTIKAMKEMDLQIRNEFEKFCRIGIVPENEKNFIEKSIKDSFSLIEESESLLKDLNEKIGKGEVDSDAIDIAHELSERTKKIFRAHKMLLEKIADIRKRF